MPGIILQNIWIHSHNGRYVTKYWCSVVSLNFLLFFVDVGCSNTKYGVWHLDRHLFHFNCRYFFAEVFDFFRSFFMIVFHLNILFMILPLAIRLKHRPCFLAFIYIAISSMLKSYPSVSCLLFSSALYFYTLT